MGFAIAPPIRPFLFQFSSFYFGHARTQIFARRNSVPVKATLPGGLRPTLTGSAAALLSDEVGSEENVARLTKENFQPLERHFPTPPLPPHPYRAVQSE